MSKQVTGSLLGRIRSLFLRASRDEEGATAVEFAFLAPVFFALIFSTPLRTLCGVGKREKGQESLRTF